MQKRRKGVQAATIVSLGSGGRAMMRERAGQQPFLSHLLEAYHGSQSQEAQVLEELWQRRKKRNAPLQKRYRKKRARRKGRQGEEPQAGHRDRTVQGAEGRQEGSQEKIESLAAHSHPDVETDGKRQ
jgi:hypothetical protein